MKQYAITFKDELANFFTLASAEDEWHARRVAEMFFYETYGLDFSLFGGDSVEIEQEGHW